uniref:UPAR/Ly6 domain-containing protein n=1 Tax=Vombatus ursinus TaxID=29139 RepID=A0A4X2LXT6_VOMUR
MLTNGPFVLLCHYTFLLKPTKCNVCSLFHIGFCYSGMKSCTASTGQHCVTKNYFIIQNSGLALYHYSKLGCKTDCENEDITSKRERLEILCCRDKDYCNMPFGSQIPSYYEPGP